MTIGNGQMQTKKNERAHAYAIFNASLRIANARDREKAFAYFAHSMIVSLIYQSYESEFF